MNKGHIKSNTYFMCLWISLNFMKSYAAKTSDDKKFILGNSSYLILEGKLCLFLFLLLTRAFWHFFHNFEIFFSFSQFFMQRMFIIWVQKSSSCRVLGDVFLRIWSFFVFLNLSGIPRKMVLWVRHEDFKLVLGTKLWMSFILFCKFVILKVIWTETINKHFVKV